MKILAMGKSVFDKLMTDKGITPNNVEQQNKLLFISINNNGGIVTKADQPFFPEDKSNVKVMYFSDVEKDTIVPLIGSDHSFVALSMTKDQAKDLYAFIKDNIIGKEAVLIHCTAGVSRSGAIASFIFDYISSIEWDTFKNDNPQIQPNAHVYRLLHDQWYKDLEFPKGWTGEDEEKFQIRVLNPLTPEQHIALYNNEHPDQHTSLEYLTKEEIKEKYEHSFPSCSKDEVIVVTSKYCNDADKKYGIDGQYFKLPLSKKFNINDNLWNGFKDCPILHVVDEPIIEEVEYSENGECKYYTHTVVIRDLKIGYFYPRKFLFPGTIFHKI